MEERLDPELAKSIAYTQRLADAAIEVVGAAHVQLDQNWARNSKVVCLALFCRSISNFRASVLLAQQEQVMEARAVVRLMYENLLWIGALRERGDAFVQDMLADERFNRESLAELVLRLASKHGGDVNDRGSLRLRSIINETRQQVPTAKKLQANTTAAQGAVETAYIEYARLSLDAVHCSITALGRHLSSEIINSTRELVVSVVPRTTQAEQLSTILHACRALIGAAVGTNELVGFTTASAVLAALVAEFEENGWHRVD